MLRRMLAFLMLLAFVTPALAHDIDIPPWWWQNPGEHAGPNAPMRYAGWDFFNTPGVGGAYSPDFGNNDGAVLTYTPPEATGCEPFYTYPGWYNQPVKFDPGLWYWWDPVPGYPWYHVDPITYWPDPYGWDWGGVGVLPLSGRIEIDLPNTTLPNPEKRVWIQLTWRDQAGLPPTGPQIELVSVDGPLYEVTPVVSHGDNPMLMGGWKHTVYEFTIRPNPTGEVIAITGNIDVDEVIVDTWCTIPEPATLALLGLGSMLVLRRRRT